MINMFGSLIYWYTDFIQRYLLKQAVPAVEINIHPHVNFTPRTKILLQMGRVWPWSLRFHTNNILIY